MPWFIDNDTHHIVWYDKKYNTDYMDGLVDTIDDNEECYLIVNNEIKEQGPLVGVVDLLEDGAYVIPVEYYEEGVIIEDVTDESEGVPIEPDPPSTDEVYYDDDDTTYPYKLASSSESPVYKFKSPKEKFGI
jgi:hypothetical protein